LIKQLHRKRGIGHLKKDEYLQLKSILNEARNKNKTIQMHDRGSAMLGQKNQRGSELVTDRDKRPFLKELLGDQAVQRSASVYDYGSDMQRNEEAAVHKKSTSIEPKNTASPQDGGRTLKAAASRKRSGFKFDRAKAKDKAGSIPPAKR
jgi:hypothetical protein